MKYIAMIKDNIVENIARWDGISEWNPEGYELIDITDHEPAVGIGYLYKDGEFEAPIKDEDE